MSEATYRGNYHGTPFERSASITTGALQDIGEEIQIGRSEDAVFFEVFNDNGATLADFCMFIKPHENADWHPYIAGDWTLKKIDILRHLEDSPASLDSGEKTSAYVKIGAVAFIKFAATTSAGTTTIRVTGTAGAD